MSSESSNGAAKSQTRSGGPRTARGKARSSQNSSKHKIFVAHVLPEEEKDAILLFKQIRKELRLNGPLELKIGRDLVQNELESHPIEKFAAQQSLKAQRLADLSEGPLLCKSPFRRPVPAEKESQPGYRTRLSPGSCATNLRVFKNHIESFGPRPDEDWDFLGSIYGDEITWCGELIVAYYKFFIAPKRTHAGNEKTLDQKPPDYKALLFDTIEQEIKVQEGLATLETLQEAVISAPGQVVFPLDEMCDRIEKYRTANTRKRSRILQELQTIRDLKREA